MERIFSKKKSICRSYVWSGWMYCQMTLKSCEIYETAPHWIHLLWFDKIADSVQQFKQFDSHHLYSNNLRRLIRFHILTSSRHTYGSIHTLHWVKELLLLPLWLLLLILLLFRNVNEWQLNHFNHLQRTMWLYQYIYHQSTGFQSLHF